MPPLVQLRRSLHQLAEPSHAERETAEFLARAVGLGSRLVFYDPFNPIFRKARAQGLAVRSSRDFGWDFSFADARTTDFVQMVMALNKHLAKRLAHEGERNSRGAAPYEGWIFRRALAAYQKANGDSERLKAAFLSIAAEIDRALESGLELG